jgi:hypothetical protein
MIGGMAETPTEVSLRNWWTLTEPEDWLKAAMSSSGCHSGGKRIEEEVERRDVAIAGDDEVGAGIGRGLAWPT